MEFSLWDQVLAFGKSWFVYPGVEAEKILIAIGLAIVFGGIWLCAHWPPLFKKPWFWAVAVASAFLTVGAIVFIQSPLKYWAGEALSYFWDDITLWNWLLLAGIPAVLISGLVQEGAKMVPMAVWWWRSGKKITPRMGLAIGAIAGAAFGAFEGFWVFSRIFGAGWTLDALGTDGFMAYAGFTERFFAIGFHAAVSALVGYGLAKGKGWQYFLFASGLHALFNYSAYFYQKGYLSLEWVEFVIAIIAIVLATVVLIVRWRLEKETPEEMTTIPDEPSPDTPPGQPDIEVPAETGPDAPEPETTAEDGTDVPGEETT